MFKKIILTFVLLIFEHKEFYAMESLEDIQNTEEKKKKEFWEKWNNYCNYDYSDEKDRSPKLWGLWAITDNVPIQYGNSKVWEHGEAYYGLSNGIGFFLSFLNFGWLKIGIIDAHINVINLILDYFKCFVLYKADLLEDVTLSYFLTVPLLIDLFCGIHIVSIKILNCIKIKLVAPIALILTKANLVGDDDDNYSTAWYIKFDDLYKISWWYAFWSPRIEINISEIINYFKIVKT